MADAKAASSHSGLSDHIAGGIAYLTFVPAVLFLIMEPYKKSSYVRYHAWQSILLFLGAFAVSIVLGFLFVFSILFTRTPHLAPWRLIELFWFVVWMVCLVNAAMGKRLKLPVIGKLAEQQAKK